jgi:hypothetical protein
MVGNTEWFQRSSVLRLVSDTAALRCRVSIRLHALFSEFFGIDIFGGLIRFPALL